MDNQSAAGTIEGHGGNQTGGKWISLAGTSSYINQLEECYC